MLIFAVEATMTVTRTSPQPRTPELSRASAGRRAVRARVMTAGMTGMTRVGLRSLQLEGKLCCRADHHQRVTDYFQLETTQVFQVF